MSRLAMGHVVVAGLVTILDRLVGRRRPVPVAHRERRAAVAVGAGVTVLRLTARRATAKRPMASWAATRPAAVLHRPTVVCLGRLPEGCGCWLAWPPWPGLMPGPAS